MNVSRWMSWSNGVDLIALSSSSVPMPNLIVHLAQVVHTPVGSTPAGIVMIPDFNDPAAPPQLMGFVAEDVEVGAYFGPMIFAGTAFEHAPVLDAKISVSVDEGGVSARVVASGFSIETRLGELSAAYKVERGAGENNDLPFFQQGIECSSSNAQFSLNGMNFPVIVPRMGITGGPAAVFAPCGVYGR